MARGGDLGRHRAEDARGELARGGFEARDAIVEAGRRFGFAFVTLDLQGYRMWGATTR